MRHRLLATASAFAMMLTGGASAASAATPSHYIVSIKTPSSVTLGQTVKVTGTVRGAGEAKVVLQQRTGSRWVNWATAKVVKGRYSVGYKPVAPGSHPIRVYAPRTKVHMSAVSPTKSVTVYKWHYVSDFINTPRLVTSNLSSDNGVAKHQWEYLCALIVDLRLLCRANSRR
jgi:hypothetical protein